MNKKETPACCTNCRYNFISSPNPDAIPSAICSSCFMENLHTPIDAVYDRMAQIEHFADQLTEHVKQYTIPQYANKDGNDQATSFSIEDCVQQLMTYINRRHARVRGSKEAIRDWLKVAHYACFIYDKLKAELNEPDVY